MSPLLFKRLSDESLGSRLALGEAAAFDELYRRYSNRLAAYGSHLLGDAASGDDVAQATMLKAYAALREGRVPDKMKPWLFRIAHNAAIDLVVRRRELPSGDLPDTPSIDREPFAGALVEALATLPDRQRRVYVLREVHGLRIDETAAELGLTAPQVEQSLFAARNRLAEQLVFGDRLNCVTVQRLAAGPLDAPERRAMKTHLRTCGECRQTLGVRGRALTLFPSATGLEWLRGLGAGLLGGGAPAAAKVGALFATASIAAGVPVAVETTAHHHAHRPALLLVEAAAAPPRIAPTATHASAAVEIVALTSARSAAVVQPHEPTSRGDRGQTSGDRHGDTAETSTSRGSSEDSGSKGIASGSGDGGSRDSHSGDGGSNRSGSPVSGSSDGGSSHSGSERSGDSGEGGTSGGRHGTSHGGTVAQTSTSAPAGELGSGDESKSGDASATGGGSKSGGSASGDGSNSGSGDQSADPMTTTSTALSSTPPLPAVTVASGD